MSSGGTQTGGLTPPNPAAVLLSASTPSDRVELAVDQEFDEIEQSVRLGTHREFLRVVLSHDTEAQELVAKMLDENPSIVHFSGHGTQSDELLFEGPDGKAVPIGTETLAKMFGAFSSVVRCVVLSACYSAEQARAIAGHIDCVIGMSDRVSDAAAHSFASSFYRAVASGRDVATSFDLAVVHIDLAGIPESHTPALFGRERAAMLVFDGGLTSNRAAAQTITPDRETLGRELYDEHYLPLVRLASSVIDSVSVCEGVVQEAFVKFLTDAAEVPADAGLVHLRQLVLDVANSRRSPQAGLPAPPAPPTPVEAPDEMTAVLRAIKMLSSVEAGTLVLDRLEQLTPGQIAETLGLDEVSVESTLASAIHTVTSLLGTAP